MKVIYINNEVKIENKNEYAVCLGMFDGVHIGHRELIKKTALLAKEKALKSAVLTFLRKKEENRIYPLETQLKLIEKTGIDTVFIIDFDKKFMDKSPEEFILYIVFVDGKSCPTIIFVYFIRHHLNQPMQTPRRDALILFKPCPYGKTDKT